MSSRRRFMMLLALSTFIFVSVCVTTALLCLVVADVDEVEQARENSLRKSLDLDAGSNTAAILEDD